jgi:hypothetical protein
MGKHVSGVAPVPDWLRLAAAPVVPAAFDPAPAVTAPTAPPVAFPADCADWDAAIEPPPPCATCGGLELWQDCYGNWHCQHCDGATFQRAQRLARKAQRLRKQAKVADG